MPIAPQTTLDLFTLIQRANVVAPERLSHYLRERPITSLSAMPDIAARRLVKDGLLSDFQAQLLLLGDPDGFTLGRYKLTKLIGRGGMSSVFLAIDTRLNRSVAVKVFTIDEDVTALQRRFEREAQASAAINHPNVVKAYDFGNDNSQLYLVMEFVDGTDLHRLVKKSGPLTLSLACHYFGQAAAGLQALHNADLIHRDVKPSNFLAATDGTVKLCDLGIVKYLSREHEPITDLHLAGSFLGTPQFLAPEQLEDSRAVDVRSDIYGLGATLYYLLTGKSPRRTVLCGGDNALTKPTPIERRLTTMPEELAAYINRMLDDDPAKRPATVAEAAYFIERYSIGPITNDSERTSINSQETDPQIKLPTVLSIPLHGTTASCASYIPITESTPTLAYGSRLFQNLASAGTRRRSRVVAISVLVLGTFLLFFSFMRPVSLGKQVKLRIDTDKSMTGSAIDVTQSGASQVVLRGTVVDSQQMRIAIEIAEHTAGVDSVKDELMIAK